MNKKEKRKIGRLLTVISSIFGIIGVFVSIFFGVQQCQEKECDSINTLRKDAESAFERKDFNLAFNLFYEISEKLPNDSCGHYLFLNRAKEMLKYGEYDERICDLLQKAYKLHSTSEINDLLKNCQ